MRVKRRPLVLTVLLLSLFNFTISPVSAEQSADSSASNSSNAAELGSLGVKEGLASGSVESSVDSSAVGSMHLLESFFRDLQAPFSVPPFTAVQLSHQEQSKNVLSSKSLLDLLMALLTGLGPLKNLVFKLQENLHPNWPYPLDPSITEAKLLKRETTQNPRIERWTVSSPSMQRNITSTVLLPADSTQPSPTVYAYEGVDGLGTSHWFEGNFAQETFAEENALLISPMTARASMYMDWQEDDPHLGRYKWETFIMDELAPVVEQEINFNGKRGAIGLSMGAGGAIMTGAAHPDFFDGIAAISGCYSTMDPLGRNTIESTVRTRGGNPENMWGPFGSPAWREHDAVLNAANFAGTELYLFTANGVIPDSALPVYGPQGSLNQPVGTLLESGTLECTKRFDEALQNAGVRAHVDYADEGAHGWYTFGPQLRPAWEAIRPALVSDIS